jgi:hypothetical protein
MRSVRVIRAVFLAAALATASLGVAASSVSAYGAADHPLAQIEFSANCNNPSFPMCQPPPNGFGLGGVWVWIEIDANQTGDIAGAGCGHIRGVGGGAGSIRGDITWWSATSTAGTMNFAPDPNSQYYVVNWGDGPVSFPKTVGHYSWHPASGVAIELQVAP